MAGVSRPRQRSIVLGENEREELARMGRSRSTPRSLVRRVQIILASAEGEPNVSIAARLGLVAQRQIRRGSFVSAKGLVARIEAFVQAYNAKATPFAWTATAEAILDKVARPCKAINGTGH